jgi:uncharacterized membrane protein YfcA
MVVGVLAGLLGVGGGFVIVPALQRYTNLDMLSIVPTSLAVMALVSIAGVAVSTMAGRVDWPIALPFSGGALLGMLGGTLVGAGLSWRMLREAFAVHCAVVAVALIVRADSKPPRPLL